MSYKNRYYLLLIAIPILLFGSWKLSISKTFETSKEYQLQKSNYHRYSDPSRILMGLQQELSSIREGDVSDPLLLDQQLMDEVSKKAGPYKIRLEAFPETHSYRSDNYQVQTFRLRFSGRYANLLKFIHYSEHEIKSCSMVSVAFERKMHRKTGEGLYVDLYFQSVYKIN
jgi:hypothetical protein